MSLLWRNQVLAGLNLHQVAIMQFAGFKKHVISKQYADVNAAHSDSGWEKALNQLQTLTSAEKQPKKSELRVILSSDYVRYLALPAHKNIIHPIEKVDFARAAYQEIYSELANGWHIVCDDAPPNRTSIAVAIDQTLVQALKDLARKHNMQLTSVQPYLMPVFNRIKLQIKSKEYYLVIVESNRLLFVHLENGDWKKIRNLSLESDWKVQVENIVHRESLALDFNSKRALMVYAPHYMDSSLPKIDGWTVKRVGISNPWVSQ